MSLRDDAGLYKVTLCVWEMSHWILINAMTERYSNFSTRRPNTGHKADRKCIAVNMRQSSWITNRLITGTQKHPAHFIIAVLSCGQIPAR